MLIIVFIIIIAAGFVIMLNQNPSHNKTANLYTYNPYDGNLVPWRSSGQPHAPITFRPDNPDNQDYGSENAIKWDVEKAFHYFPHRNYNDYGMYDVPIVYGLLSSPPASAF